MRFSLLDSDCLVSLSACRCMKSLPGPTLVDAMRAPTRTAELTET
jgi:hypothetical protein